MVNKYQIKKTDDRYYAKLSYVGETLEQAKHRIERKRKEGTIKRWK